MGGGGGAETGDKTHTPLAMWLAGYLACLYKCAHVSSWQCNNCCCGNIPPQCPVMAQGLGGFLRVNGRWGGGGIYSAFQVHSD